MHREAGGSPARHRHVMGEFGKGRLHAGHDLIGIMLDVTQRIVLRRDGHEGGTFAIACRVIGRRARRMTALIDRDVDRAAQLH